MVLVTGATGILGRVIVLELLKRGKTVRATKRPTSNLDEVRDSYRFYTENPDHFFNQIEWQNVDFNDITSLESALIDIDEIYHCAATVSFHPDKQYEMFQTNIEGTKNLLYACDGKNIEKFCFVSSTAVLDGVNEQGEVDEQSDYNSKLHHSGYGVSKHFSEMEVWRAAAEGLNTIIVNPGVIIGSGNWNESSGLIFKSFANQFTFCGGTSYIDVRDVAKASVELMEKNVFGQRFVLISENKLYSEVGTFVRSKLNFSAPKILPTWFLGVGRVLNFFFGWFFPSLKMANRVNIESVCTFPTFSNRKVKETLNTEFIPVLESLDFHLKNYLSDQKNRSNT